MRRHGPARPRNRAWESPINRETVSRVLAAVAVLGECRSSQVAELADVFAPQQVHLVLHVLAAMGKVQFRRRSGDGTYPTLLWSVPQTEERRTT